MRHRLDRRDADATRNQHRVMRCGFEREGIHRRRAVQAQADREGLVHGGRSAAALRLAKHRDLVGIGAQRARGDRVRPRGNGAVAQPHGHVEVRPGLHRRQRRAVGRDQFVRTHRRGQLPHAGDAQRERSVPEVLRDPRRGGLRGGELGAHLLHLRPQRRDNRAHLGLGQPRGDVLRAIPVPALEMDDEGAFDGRAVGLVAHGGEQHRIILGVHQRDPPQQLEPAAVEVVHDDQRNAIVLAEVAHAQVLHVAAEVGERERPRVQHLEEALGPAAVLHVRPARLADGGLEEMIGLGDELRLPRRQRVSAIGVGVQEGVLLPAAQFGLDLADGGREGDV